MIAWSQFCTFFASGEPKGQPRPRAFAKRFGDVWTARMYDAKTAEGWKGCIAAAAAVHRPSSPLAGPVRVDWVVFFPRPQRLCRAKDPAEPIPHLAKPDRDNLDKAIMDCLTQLGFWGDDAQVCAGLIEKYYVAKGDAPGARITIRVGA